MIGMSSMGGFGFMPMGMGEMSGFEIHPEVIMVIIGTHLGRMVGMGGMGFGIYPGTMMGKSGVGEMNWTGVGGNNIDDVI